jgi:GT2 family glycosyltransferase
VGLRYALRQGDGAYIWLLNNDTVISSGTLTAMVRAAQAHCGITGSVLRFYADPTKVQVYGGGTFSPHTGIIRAATKAPPQRLDFINGASMMLDLAMIATIGGFDERIFMYFEENDYCIRALQAGYTIRLADAAVFHKGGASSGGSDSYWSWDRVYRHKLYVMLKHYGPGFWMVPTSIAWLLLLVMPNVGTGRRKAAREALGHMARLVVTPRSAQLEHLVATD